MDNKHDDQDLLRNLALYVKEQDIHIADECVELLNDLLQEPIIKSLLTLWLSQKNHSQLNYFLGDMLQELQVLDPATKVTTIRQFLEKAQLLQEFIHRPGKALQGFIKPTLTSRLSIPSNNLVPIDPNHPGWSTLDRPLFTISIQDMEKLNKYTFYINAKILTANTVLAMTPDQSAAFDAAVNKIIATNYDLLIDSETGKQDVEEIIFSDMLIGYLTQSPEINKLLATISHTPFTKPETTTQDKLSDLLGQNPENQSTSSDSDAEESMSDLSEDRPLTAQQQANLDTSDLLSSLIGAGKIKPSDIPDRELTDEDDAQYARLLYAPDPKPFAKKEQDSFGATTDESSASSRASSNAFKHDIGKTRNNAGSHTVHSKASSHKSTFYAPINDETHNAKLQEKNRTQRKLDPLGPKNGPMPSWHKDAMQRMRAKEKNTEEPAKTTKKPPINRR